MRKKFIYIGIFFFILNLLYGKQVFAYYIKTDIDNFPDSYKPYLRELEKRHNNWKFEALYTELSWNYVIDNENVFGKNLVPKSYSDRWKNTKPGEYNVEIDGNWVDCSRQAVEYTMDPRNFLNEVRIFQFENLSSNMHDRTKESVEKILYGTEFYQNKVNYLDEAGNTIYTDKSYSELIIDAASVSGVSAFHLASHIRQEVGPFLSHKSISGDVEGYRGLYNFYNIGATSSTTELGAIKNGLQYARDGKGASQWTKDLYMIPWTTKARAVTGGAIFIGRSYINRGQNNLYLQKFHVVDNSSNTLFWHQYMTNVLDPYSESKTTYNGYYNNGLLNDTIHFIIPIYDNMPNIMTDSPSINPDDYVDDGTKVIVNVSTSLNVRSGPGTQYEVITSLYNQNIITRLKKGCGSGELWDKVLLDNGIIGYVFQSYVESYKDIIDNVDENNIIYGDVNGDKKINSIDLLVLQRHILGIIELQGANYKAARISRDGKKPSTVDLLLIQRHILGIQLIEQ